MADTPNILEPTPQNTQDERDQQDLKRRVEEFTVQLKSLLKVYQLHLQSVIRYTPAGITPDVQIVDLKGRMDHVTEEMRASMQSKEESKNE